MYYPTSLSRTISAKKTLPNGKENRQTNTSIEPKTPFVARKAQSNKANTPTPASPLLRQHFQQLSVGPTRRLLQSGPIRLQTNENNLVSMDDVSLGGSIEFNAEHTLGRKDCQNPVAWTLLQSEQNNCDNLQEDFEHLQLDTNDEPVTVRSQPPKVSRPLAIRAPFQL